MGELVILQDTREPNPDIDAEEALFWPAVYVAATKGARAQILPVELRRVTLETGDYSLPGLEDLVAIERKTLPDLIGTLFGGVKDSVGERRANMDRFRAELDRMAAIRARNGRAIIVIEASREDVWRHRYTSRVRPISVIKAVDSFDGDYGVSAHWGGSRDDVQIKVGEMLARIWEQYQGAGEAFEKAKSRGRAASLPWIGRGLGEVE